ncbi:hypothetical protein V8C86DRAFT_2955816 [Haematococcus lacustris]
MHCSLLLLLMHCSLHCSLLLLMHAQALQHLHLCTAVAASWLRLVAFVARRVYLEMPRLKMRARHCRLN